MKPDFDKFKTESEAEEEFQQEQFKLIVEKRNNELQKWKKGWLIGYNIIHFLLYIEIFLDVLIGLYNAKPSPKSHPLGYLPTYRVFFK